MKLRGSFPVLQFLFHGSLALILLGQAAIAQQRIITRDGKSQDVKIVGVTGQSVQVQVGAGTVGVPLSSIAQVVMDAPPEFNAALVAYQAQQYDKALAAAKIVTDQFAGLPTRWAQQATAMLGDIYVAMDNIAQAEAAYKRFQQVYPGEGTAQAGVGMARLAVLKKNFDEAEKRLGPVAEEALKQPVPPAGAALAYSQTFFLLGQIHEERGEHAMALENYLRTVTLFPADTIAVSSAQQRADAIRKEHGVVVP